MIICMVYDTLGKTQATVVQTATTSTILRNYRNNTTVKVLESGGLNCSIPSKSHSCQASYMTYFNLSGTVIIVTSVLAPLCFLLGCRTCGGLLLLTQCKSTKHKQGLISSWHVHNYYDHYTTMHDIVHITHPKKPSKLAQRKMKHIKYFLKFVKINKLLRVITKSSLWTNYLTYTNML